MTQNITPPSPAPGHLGNLTLEQEQTLGDLWAKLIENFDKDPAELASGEEEASPDSGSGTPTESAAADAKPADMKKSKSNLNFLRLKRNKGDSDDGKSKGSSPATPTAATSDDTVDSAAAALAKTDLNSSPAAGQAPAETLREAFWGVVQADHPDSILLRFLRARKWNVDKALEMLITALRWRLEFKVDQIILKGEAGIGSQIMHKGISFLHGTDKLARPVILTRVCLHRKDDQTVEEMTQFLVWTIETIRLLLHPPVETVTIIFDLSDFTMANMDFNFVKILIRCLEAYYPESLGSLLIYNAPWIFPGIWRMISPMLDAVVASKVQFITSKKQFQDYIDPEHLVDWLGGASKFTYEYVTPVADENHRMADEEAKHRILARHTELTEKFERATRAWMAAVRAYSVAGANDKAAKQVEVEKLSAERASLVADLRTTVTELDPYVRARTYYHRIGVIKDDGAIDWTPITTNGYQKDAKKTSA
ncbi:hypothetical protein IWQ60_011595 [Tieghemiomyces parasiticus]|uniref:CRAL-TRIO domain-containing protein n=1 Tax=Tieghemiomyces parasiticus TaxID=78921 RepID=A0A9W7ZIB0_9FUNG|nr:hypothetical protein IWQ60_011595 [Tieghemiomyces parasiticus]